MTWAYIGAAAVTTIGTAALRPPGVGAAAPAPDNGGAPAGLLGAAPDSIDPNNTQNSGINLQELISKLPPPKEAPRVQVNDQNNPVTSMPSVFNTDAQNTSMTQDAEQSGFGDKFGGFLGGVDDTLQSPAKMLGLGLLGNVNGNLPGVGLLLSGLLGSGLFGNKK